MKRGSVSKAGAMLAGMALAALTAQPSQAAKTCSNSTLDGAYGYTVTGTVNGQPFAATGRLDFDGKGSFDNIRTISQNGVIQRNVPGDGTYTVGADCRGTLTFTQGGVVTLGTDLVVDDKGDELRMIATNSGTVLTVVGRKQF